MKGFMGRLMPLWGLYLLVFGALSLLFGDLETGLLLSLGILPFFILCRIRKDALCGWYYLAFTLPDGRRRTVRSYYTVNVLMLFSVLFVLFLILAVDALSVGDEASLACNLWILLMWFTVQMLFSSMLLPVIISFFKRKWLCLTVTVIGTVLRGGMIFCLTVYLENTVALFDQNINATLILGFGIAAAVACMMYIASYLFAASIMKKKELV
ncbi:MAG: ABC-2 transporter permease [Clostridia bacterium]|nr:ABC-2 transporter permease [Clostridia bacterium]